MLFGPCVDDCRVKLVEWANDVYRTVVNIRALLIYPKSKMGATKAQEYVDSHINLLRPLKCSFGLFPPPSGVWLIPASVLNTWAQDIVSRNFVLLLLVHQCKGFLPLFEL